MASRRNNGYSAKQSRRMTRRVEDSTLGSHVQRTAPSHARHSRSSDTSYSRGRVSSRASRSEVPGLMPQSTTRERAGAYHTRVQQARYMEQVQRRAKRKRVLLIVAIIAVVLVAASAVGCVVFMGQVGSAMALRDSDATAALSAPAEEGPAYTLISAELGEAAVPFDNGGPDVLLLAAVDEKKPSLALVCIPGNTRITMDDNVSHPISDIAASGDAALINEVEKLTEVEISHFVKIDERGLKSMVDALGGITVNVDQEIDDPHAGPSYIPRGQQTLSGEQALTFLRATNLKFGEQDRMSNQLAFAASLLSTLFSANGTLDFAGRLDAVGSLFQTDYTSSDLMNLASALGDITASRIACIPLPGYMDADLGVESSGKTMWVTSVNDVRDLMQEISSGATAQATATSVDTTGVNPRDFTIEVQNGTNLVGAAASTADTLSAAGFLVVEVGNADQPIYEETLLAYHGENGRAYAQKVIDTLGVGRIVDSPEYYDFETDVLLILGSDYKPQQ